MRLFTSLFLTATPAPGSPGAPATAPAPPAIPPARPAEHRASDLVTRMLAQYGTNENAMQQMALRIVTAEDQAAEATRTASELRARLPEGSRVITKQEAEQLDKLRPLGTVDEIVGKVKRAGELEAENARNAKATDYRKAATALGLDPEAFVEYGLRVDLPIEFKAAQVREGSKIVQRSDVPFVRKPGDEKAPWQAMTDYLPTLPAHEQRYLKAPATPAQQSANGIPMGTPATPGVEFPRSQVAVPPGPRDYVAEHIARRQQQAAQTPNPLFPQPANTNLVTPPRQS